MEALAAHEALHEHGAHFVLATADKRPIAREWQKMRPELAAVTAHAKAGGLVGVIPASLGCFVLDVDEGGTSGVEALQEALGAPITVIATRREDGYHVWHRAPDGTVGNQKWQLNGAAGDIRGSAGFVVLWDAPKLTDALARYFEDAAPADPNKVPRWTNGTRGPEAVRNAPVGTRNDTLFREATCVIRAAARDAGLPAWEVEATLASAERTATGDDDEFKRSVIRLAALPPHEYDRKRQAEAKRLHVRVGTLDDDVRAARASTSGDNALQGRALEWPEPEPWPELVDGAAMLTEIAALIALHVSLPAALADAVALWTVMTWLHDRLDVSPFLNVTSATKRCGKSLLLEVVTELVYRPLPTSNVTPAMLFRIIEKTAPTLLLDEADRTFAKKDNPDLIAIINSSQRRSGAYVTRCVGEDHEPRRFSSWCPKAMAGIGSLPDTVLDRALVVRLERRPPGQDLPLWRDRDRAAIERVQRQVNKWTDDNAEAIVAQWKDVAFPTGLHDRARDAWEALLAIADVAGGQWAGNTGRAWRACEYVNVDTGDEESGEREKLLADLQQVFREAGDPSALATSSILDALHAMEGRPWSEWKRGKPLSPRGLSDLLKPFKVKPQDVRLGGRVLKGYKRDPLERVWRAYFLREGGSQSATPRQVNEINDLRESLSATNPTAVADTNGRKSLETKACRGVADTTPPFYEEWQERAVIMEYDAGMTRAEAERAAWELILGTPERRSA